MQSGVGVGSLAHFDELPQMPNVVVPINYAPLECVPAYYCKGYNEDRNDVRYAQSQKHLKESASEF